MEHEQPFTRRADRLEGVEAAFDDQRTPHSVGHLEGCRTMYVGVIPESAGLVIVGNVETILEPLPRFDLEQDIVTAVRG